MKKLTIGIMIILMALALFSGLAVAQSGTYVPPPEPPVPPVPPIPPVTPPIMPEVPPNWVKINVLDKTVLFIDLCPTLGYITATIPEIYEPYELRWESNNPNIATVTAQSAAVVTPVSVGSTWVLAVFTSAGTTYYDAVLVNVTPCAPPPGPTPPTTGGTTVIAGTMIGLLLIFTALTLVRRLRLES